MSEWSIISKVGGCLMILLVGTALPCLAQTDGLYGSVVKEIRVIGARYTKEHIITRELASQVGQPYLEENVAKDLQRLSRLPFLNSVSIQPLNEDDAVVLLIDVVEVFPYLPTISIELSDENGVSAGPGFKSVNLFGSGISFSGSARFGGATNIYAVLDNPWFAGDHLSYRFEVFRRDRANKLDDYKENAYELNLRLGSYLGENGRLATRLSYMSLESDTAGITLSADNHDNLLTLGLSIGFDSRDNYVAPRRGWWTELEVSKTGLLAGNGDFWLLVFDVRKYVPLGARYSLSLFSLTTLTTGKVGRDIPVYLDYHVGGTNSVRGWELDARSGKNQVLGTTEWSYSLGDLGLKRLISSSNIDFRIAVFGDLGIAWNDPGEFARDQFIGGGGVGMRMLSPLLKVVRLDFALGETGAEISFHVGYPAKPDAQRLRVR